MEITEPIQPPALESLAPDSVATETIPVAENTIHISEPTILVDSVIVAPVEVVENKTETLVPAEAEPAMLSIEQLLGSDSTNTDSELETMAAAAMHQRNAA